MRLPSFLNFSWNFICHLKDPCQSSLWTAERKALKHSVSSIHSMQRWSIDNIMHSFINWVLLDKYKPRADCIMRACSDALYQSCPVLLYRYRPISLMTLAFFTFLCSYNEFQYTLVITFVCNECFFWSIHMHCIAENFVKPFWSASVRKRRTLFSHGCVWYNFQTILLLINFLTSLKICGGVD